MAVSCCVRDSTCTAIFALVCTDALLRSTSTIRQAFIWLAVCLRVFLVLELHCVRRSWPTEPKHTRHRCMKYLNWAWPLQLRRRHWTILVQHMAKHTSVFLASKHFDCGIFQVEGHGKEGTSYQRKQQILVLRDISKRIRNFVCAEIPTKRTVLLARKLASISSKAGRIVSAVLSDPKLTKRSGHLRTLLVTKPAVLLSSTTSATQTSLSYPESSPFKFFLRSLEPPASNKLLSYPFSSMRASKIESSPRLS